MKPTDIVRTTCDLTPLTGEHLPTGTRLELLAVRTTQQGPRWMVRDKHSILYYDIPEDAMEVIA
jgi:hypothetical protein